MKKIKTIITAVELITMLIIITGCFPNIEKSSTATSNNNTAEFPAHIIDNNIEHLNIDADIVYPSNFDAQQKISISSAESRAWDRESIVSKIANGRQIIEYRTEENSGPNDLLYSYTFDDNSDLVFTSGNIIYETEIDKSYQYAYYFDSFESYIYDNTLSKIFANDEIEGLNKSDALNDTKEIISLLNLDDILLKPNIYSLDADTLNKLKNESNTFNKDGSPLEDFGEEQEAYFLIYPVIYQNIPSLKMVATGENELINSSSIYFIYGRNGLLSFQISGIFDTKSKEQESSVFSPVNAIEEVKNFFDSIIMDSDIDISLMKLCYIKRTDFENLDKFVIEPVWFIYGKYENIVSDKPDLEKKSIEPGKYITLVSAVTGKTIPIVSIGGW